MSSPKDIPVDERMQRLERRARVIRSRLLRAVDALDARRHQVVEIGEHAKEIAKPAALGLLGIAALFGASAFAFSLAFKKRKQHRLSSRISHALQKLDLAPRPSMARQIFERVTLTLATFAATELAKRATKNLVDGRLPDGRLAVGAALHEHHDRLSHTQLRPNGGAR